MAQNMPLQKTETLRCATFRYDFAKHGGAQGDIVLSDDSIPDDAIIWNGIIEVKTSLAGSGATVALKVSSSEDVLAATAITSMTAGDMLDAVCDGTAANAIKLAAAGTVTATIATADLTAGVFDVKLLYFMGN